MSHCELNNTETALPLPLPLPPMASSEVSDNTKPKRNKYALLCSLLASMTSILLGYDTGVMSGAIKYIKRDLHVSDTQIGLLTGTINMYALVGAFFAGRTSDWIGRRYTMVLAAVIFFVAAFLMGFANSYGLLMFGRFVAGIGVGYAMMIAPVYTAEVAPMAARGFLSSFPEVFINFGVLLGYISNYAFYRLPLKLGWRIMLGAGAIPSAFLVVGVLVMPESPRWLVLQGRLGDAKKVLDKTSTSLEESQQRLAAIKEAVGLPENCNDDVTPVPKKNRGSGVWRELFLHPSPAVKHILIAGIGIHFFQQASGVDSVVIYSPRIFEKAGIKSDSLNLLTTVGVGVTKTIFILVTTFFVDKVGRRKLLLTSCGGFLLSLYGLACGLTVINRHPDRAPTAALVICIICTMACVAFFSMGMGPIAWVYSSEIFPLRLRAQGCGMAVAVNRMMSGIILIIFLPLQHAITIGGAFFLFGGIATVAWIFFFTLLPETRGRGLEDMEVLFGTFFRWRTTMKELGDPKPANNAKGDLHPVVFA